MTLRLDTRVAVVTGAGRGMGRATALFLAKQGAKIVVNDLGCEVDGGGASTSPASDVAEEIIRSGGTAVANHQSVATMEGANDIVNCALKHFGRIDILVNVAAIAKLGMVVNMAESDWDLQAAANLKGSYACIKAALPHMMAQKYGRIINFSSGAAMGSAGAVAYGATKAGVLGITRALAKEVRDYGITVNALMPVANTRTFLGYWVDNSQSQSDMVVTDQPPETIAPLVAYLASERAARITGNTLSMRFKGTIQRICDPHVVQTIYKETPWTVDDIDRVIGQLVSE